MFADACFIPGKLFNLVLIPLLIFLARIVDVSMGTMRIIFVARGYKYWAALIGFFEVTVWLLAITQIMRHFNTPWYYIAYAAGFATGTFIGIRVENKLAMGAAILRVIVTDLPAAMTHAIKASGYGYTCMSAEGAYQPVKILFIIVKRKDINTMLQVIKSFNPDAVYTIEDVRSVSAAIFPQLQPADAKSHRKLFKSSRKSKTA